jgi:hypothetical protein
MPQLWRRRSCTTKFVLLGYALVRFVDSRVAVFHLAHE